MPARRLLELPMASFKIETRHNDISERCPSVEGKRDRDASALFKSRQPAVFVATRLARRERLSVTAPKVHSCLGIGEDT